MSNNSFLRSCFLPSHVLILLWGFLLRLPVMRCIQAVIRSVDPNIILDDDDDHTSSSTPGQQDDYVMVDFRLSLKNLNAVVPLQGDEEVRVCSMIDRYLTHVGR